MSCRIGDRLCFLRQYQLGQVQRVASPQGRPCHQPLSPFGGTPLTVRKCYVRAWTASTATRRPMCGGIASRFRAPPSSRRGSRERRHRSRSQVGQFTTIDQSHALPKMPYEITGRLTELDVVTKTSLLRGATRTSVAANLPAPADLPSRSVATQPRTGRPFDFVPAFVTAEKAWITLCSTDLSRFTLRFQKVGLTCAI